MNWRSATFVMLHLHVDLHFKDASAAVSRFCTTGTGGKQGRYAWGQACSPLQQGPGTGRWIQYQGEAGWGIKHTDVGQIVGFEGNTFQIKVRDCVSFEPLSKYVLLLEAISSKHKTTGQSLHFELMPDCCMVNNQFRCANSPLSGAFVSIGN